MGAHVHRENPLCPSAQAGMADGVLIGVVGGTVQAPRVAYLADAQPVSDELLRLAAPARASEVFRVAAPCAGHGCGHFDGRDCRLVSRVVEQLPVVVHRLPACAIRPACRWWNQSGREACQRCPQVVTEVAQATPLMQAVGRQAP